MMLRSESEPQEFRARDRSNNRARLIESRREHRVGERADADTVVRIPLTVTYTCDLAGDEVAPMIGVHTSLRRPPRVGYTRFNVVWSADRPGEVSVPHRLAVHVGVSMPWPRDASVWFQVFAQVKSSEGAYRYEKAGSGVLPLHTLVGSRAESAADDATATVDVPLALQEARIMQPTPLFKGSIRVKYRYGSATGKTGAPVFFDAAESFQPESEWDVSERNVKFLEATMMQAVTATIAPFEKPVVQSKTGMAGGFEPTDPRLAKIHAPLFVTEACALTGARYWGNLALERDYDPAVYTRLMEIALERDRMAPDSFVERARAFEASPASAGEEEEEAGRPEYDLRLNAVAAVFVSACTVVANAVPYIADYAELNAGRMHGAAVDAKTGAVLPIGATPAPKGPAQFSKRKSHVTTESFDDPLARGADDCEGVSRLTARVYVGFRDGVFPPDNQLLHAAQAIARAYTVTGVLGSVQEHARNINESGKGGKGGMGDQPLIDSPQDAAGGVGAHMWTMFWPTRHLLRLASKTSATRLPRWTDGRTYRDFPPWHERLPVLVGEGTGMLNPQLLPPAAYQEGLEAKRDAVNVSIRQKEAMVRLMTDARVADLVHAQQLRHDHHADPRLHLDPPGELAKMQFVREQPTVMEDRNRRVSNFYMRATTLFPLVRAEDEIRYDVARAEAPLPATWAQQAEAFYVDDARGTPEQPRRDVPYPVYSWRMLIPVEAGPRPATWNGTFGPRQEGHETFDPTHLRWGVNMGDMLYKREHVALLRGPSTTTRQEKTVGAVLRHLPPLAPMRPLTDADRARVEKTQHTLNQMLQRKLEAFDAAHPGTRTKPLLAQDDRLFRPRRHIVADLLNGNGQPLPRSAWPEGYGADGNTELQLLFLKSQDATTEQISKVATRVAQCPYVRGARFVAEQAIPQVGTWRLEVVMDVDDAAQLNEGADSGFRWVTPHAL